MSNVVAISVSKRNRQKLRGGEAGFGVMELAIVVAIIAIMATTLLIILAGVCATSYFAVRMLALIAPQGARVAARHI